MFKKIGWKKHIFSLLSFGMALSVPIVSTSLSLETKVLNNDPSVIIFENKAFKDYDAALKYYMHKQKNNIKRKSVVGSLNDATIDEKFNILDKKRLPDYNPETISFAYKSSNGQLVKDINIAKNSFARPQDAVSRYTFPGSNKFFKNKEEAMVSASKSFQNQVIAVSKFKLPNNSTDFYLNTSNQKDIQKLKDTLLNKDGGFGNVGIINPKSNAPISFQDINNLDPNSKQGLETLAELSDSNSSKNNHWGIKFINSYDDKNSYIINKDKNDSSGKNIDLSKEDNIKYILKKMTKNDVDTQDSQGVNPNYNIENGEVSFGWVNSPIMSRKVLSVEHFHEKRFGNWERSYRRPNLDQVTFDFGNQSGSIQSWNIEGNWKFRDFRFSDFMNESIKPFDGSLSFNTFFNDLNTYYLASNTPQNMNIKKPLINFKLNRDMQKSPKVDLSYAYMVFDRKIMSDGSKFNWAGLGIKRTFFKYSLMRIRHMKINSKYKLDIENKDVLKAKLFSSNSQGKLKKIITYNNKPVFEMKNNFKNKVELYNVSDHFIRGNDYSKYTSQLNPTPNLQKNITINDLKKKLNGFNGFISRTSLDDNKVNLLEVYRQYLNSLNRFINNKNIFPQTSNIKRFLLRQNNMLILSGSTHYRNNMIYNKNFNPALWGTHSKEGVRDIKDYYGINSDKKTFAPQVSQVWIYYDSFGNKSLKIEGSDSGGEYNNSVFDGADLMKENVINAKKIAIDNEHVFVHLDNQEIILVKNQINNIYHFNYENINRYFRTFNDLKAYLLDVIKRDSYRKKM